MTRRLPAVAGLALGVLLLTGCSSERGLSETAARALQADVAAVAAEVRSGDRAGALAALKALRDEVARQSATGQISEARAQEVLAAADDVAEDLPAAPAPRTAPTPSPTRSPAPVRPPSKGDEDKGDEDDEEEKGKGKGKD